jgi:hypothetical protein
LEQGQADRSEAAAAGKAPNRICRGWCRNFKSAALGARLRVGDWRSDYEALLARTGDEASEDAMTLRIVEATGVKIARGEDVALPAAVWAAIENGEHPIRAMRK